MRLIENLRLKLCNKKAVLRIFAFLVFQIVFAAAAMPTIIFYGPFENVKKTLVGTSWATLSHQYIAKFFLSDKAIENILSKDDYYIEDIPKTEDGPDEEIKIKVPVIHTDKLELSEIDGGDFVGKMLTITDPTRICIGYSSQMPRVGEITSSIAKREEAVAAINAGGFVDQNWAGTGGMPDGFIIHNSNVISNSLDNETTKLDTVAFTDKGVFIVGKHSIEDLKKLKIKEAVSFGPPLIINGKKTITKGDGGWGIAPRTAIGQKQNGEVVFLTIDGRSLKSFGACLRDVQDILYANGVVNASNLDGGSSTTMYYNGKVINKPSDAFGERAVPSVFYVSSFKGATGK